MAKFAKPNHMHSRYQQLSPQLITIKLEEKSKKQHLDGQQYATFIKSLNSNNDNFEKPLKLAEKPKQSPKRSFSPAQLTSSLSSKQQQKQQRIKANASLQTINQLKMKNEETHNKKMKSIEDFMWRCKQEERELKRMEGDILKQEKSLQKTMRDYKNEIYEKQQCEEDLLSSTITEEEKLKHHYYTTEQQITKEKTNRNINQLQKEKENESKSLNMLNSLDFRYETVASAIHLKRNEVEELVNDFKNRLKQKEEEEFRLKKEFADLTLEIKMEAQKRRRQSAQDKNLKSKHDESDIHDQINRLAVFKDNIQDARDRNFMAEGSKRRMSRDLQEFNSKVSSQEREEGRKMMDIKSKLQSNAKNQKEAQTQSELLQMKRQAVMSDEKIYSVNARRQAIQDMITQQRKHRNEASMNEWLKRNLDVSHEVEKQNLKDHIGHFKKVVSKNDEEETALHNQIRHLESNRRKQEQNVDNLRHQLLLTQKQNKELIKKTAVDCEQQEVFLQQKLQREVALLSKALGERQDKIQTLLKCQGGSKEDKHMLKEQEKIHNRLIRIEKKSNLLRSQEQYG